MQTPVITLTTSQWQQAIHESWLLCPDNASRLAIQTALDYSHYIYFSTMRHGVAQHNQQLNTVLASLMTHPCWCFYQEAEQKPALEACLFIPQATQHRTLQEWTQLISDLGQEAFVSGTASGHQVWQRATQEDHYSPTTLNSIPRTMTTESLKHFIS